MSIQPIQPEYVTSIGLPSLRQILTDALNAIENANVDLRTPEDPITDVTSTRFSIESLPEPVRTSLIAIHQIYPHLLLSSLDLLDNALVTRYSLTDCDLAWSSSPLYYVRSSQMRQPKLGTSASRIAYEVRPIAWHCTCPSFAFSAFSSRSAFDPFELNEEDFPKSDRWGGEMRGGQLAICKHLLAVVIGERLHAIPEKQVDMDTLASYAFGEA
jgi:hypothetical protein